MNAKQRATEIYNQHIALAESNGRLFRKTVMDQLIAETGCSLAAAATHYNNSKKTIPVDGLGRAPIPKGVRKMPTKGKTEELVPDEECFSVMELNPGGDDVCTVGRCFSFILQGDASECFDEKRTAWPSSRWIMFQGLGPNAGDTFKLDAGEREIKRWTGSVVIEAQKKAEMKEEITA
jgi:hypothetical protein